MTAILWILGGFFVPGAALMFFELRNAPEATEDENGFHVIREARPRKRVSGHGLGYPVRRASRAH
jgi:hypothetical protein